MADDALIMVALVGESFDFTAFFDVGVLVVGV
jgi:hypothetical protein